MIRLKRILHPTDFSEDSRCALEVACALARDQAAGVVLLHVLPRPTPIGQSREAAPFKEAHAAEDLQTYRQEMLGRLKKLQEEASYNDVQVLVQDGDVVEAILRTADERPCDLIVMGSRGKSGKNQVVLGSVAADVSRRALCSVVTVRTPRRVPTAGPRQS